MDSEYYNTCAGVSDTDIPRFFQIYKTKSVRLEKGEYAKARIICDICG